MNCGGKPPSKEGLDFHVEQKGSELLPAPPSPRGPVGDRAQLGGPRQGLNGTDLGKEEEDTPGRLVGRPGTAARAPGLRLPLSS